MKLFKDVFKFEWDKGNIGKNKKHKVEDHETEQAFLDKNKITIRDEKHSERESRYLLLGETKSSRKLSVIYTLRGKKIRVISARDMSRKERGRYEKTI